MKKVIFTLSIALYLLIEHSGAQNTFPSSGSVGIGTSSPNASSLLDITSTTKGMLAPRMTLAQRNAIASPATGLMIFQTNSTPGFYYYNGSAWAAVTPAAGANRTLSNLTAPTAINVDLLPNVNKTINLGSSSLGWMNVYAAGSYYIGTNKVLDVTGVNNTFVGVTENSANTGNGNTFIGAATGEFNTTGSLNTATGTYALGNNTTGELNSAYGFSALGSNNSGYKNTGTGIYSLALNTTGYLNTAHGYYSLYSNTTGFNNSAMGTNAMQSNTTGSRNVAIGNMAMLSNISGNDNVAAGNNAMQHNTTGYSNIAIGTSALFANMSASNLVAIGDSSLYNERSGDTKNIAIGSKAMYTNTSGYYNTAIGYSSQYLNTSGYNNTSNGFLTLYSNTTGYSNTVMGSSALQLNTTGIHNSAFGDFALATSATGNYNTAQGSNSLFNNYAGSGNTAIGFNSLGNNNGNANTSVGYASLSTNTTGSTNTAVGYGADASSGALTNIIAIGYNAVVNASNKAVIGNNSVTVIGGHVGWSILSDGRFKTNIKENVPGLEFINKLRPVTYNIDELKFAKFIGVKDSLLNIEKDAYSKVSQKKRTGFVAQEVEKTAQQISYDFDGINHPQNDKDNYSLVYADFIPSLVKAVQELSKQNEQLQKQVDTLKALLQNQSVTPAPATFSQSQKVQLGASSRLEQNFPNPFTNATTINYYLPENNGNALINFYNNSGAIIKTVKLNGSGNGSIVVNTNELPSGIYQYTLLVDGKLIGTKQMVQAK